MIAALIPDPKVATSEDLRVTLFGILGKTAGASIQYFLFLQPQLSLLKPVWSEGGRSQTKCLDGGVYLMRPATVP